jgi:aldehyde dehydrogenase (NAD+)
MTTIDDWTPPAVHLHIGGDRFPEASGGVYEHRNAHDDTIDALVPLAGEAEIGHAVRVSHEAFQSWRRTRPAERRRLLMRLADLIEENQAEFTRRGTLDNATPVDVSAGFVAPAVEWTRYYAGWADKYTSDVTSSYARDGEFAYTLAQPYGVVAIIITWNGPLISLAMKIPPALAAGNTVVVKPSELTPFCGELFMDLVEQAGFPPGVVSLLPGDAAAGAALVAHPLVQKVSFTGGPTTARAILRSCAEFMKPVVLELGGKSANLVFEDADLDAACLHGAVMSVGALSGQGCALPTRMLVQRSVYDRVVDQVAAIAASLPVGNPRLPGTASGPVINKAALERILAMIGRASTDGARLVSGGSRLGGDLADGYYLQPTVFADVDPSSELAQQEVFGPVLAITPFTDEAEAVAIANATRYGLSAYVQTNDISRAHRLAEELVTGEVLINGGANLAVQRPFGGLGLSGVGKEGGRQGLEEFLRIKGVGIGP